MKNVTFSYIFLGYIKFVGNKGLYFSGIIGISFGLILSPKDLDFGNWVFVHSPFLRCVLIGGGRLKWRVYPIDGVGIGEGV